MRKPLLIIALAAAVVLLVAAPAQATDEAAGALFKTKCAMCHGADGAGKTPMGQKMGLKDLASADVQKKTDADLFSLTTRGKDKMPGYEGKLTKDQITDLVKFIRTLKK